MIDFLKKFGNDQSGAAVIEAVLMVPIVGALGLGTIDASLLVLQRHKVETNLASAAGYLAKTKIPQSFETQAKNLATTGQILTGGTPMISGWTNEKVTIAYKSVPNTLLQSGTSYKGGDTVRVIQISTDIQYKGLGLLSSLRGGKINLKAAYEERITGDLS